MAPVLVKFRGSLPERLHSLQGNIIGESELMQQPSYIYTEKKDFNGRDSDISLLKTNFNRNSILLSGR